MIVILVVADARGRKPRGLSIICHDIVREQVNQSL
jgi:hypothetical protein